MIAFGISSIIALDTIEQHTLVRGVTITTTRALTSVVVLDILRLVVPRMPATVLAVLARLDAEDEVVLAALTTLHS